MKDFSGLYMVDFGCGIKIGISNAVLSRVRTYKSPWCLPIKRILVLECKRPKLVEAALKRHFKFKIKGASTEFITNKDLHSLALVAFSFRNIKPHGLGKWYRELDFEPTFYELCPDSLKRRPYDVNNHENKA